MVNHLEATPVEKRYTFGFLDEDSANDSHNLILEGIAKAAGELDIDIVRFSYYPSFNAYSFSHQVDMIQKCIQEYNLDGLLFLGWAQAGPKYNYEEFMGRFDSMPLLSLGTIIKDIPSVYFAGDEIVAQMTRHLIDEHKYTSIAYVEHHREDNRRDAYERVMSEYGIYDPLLYVGNDVLSLTADQHKERSKRAVEILLDERKLKVQAIISLHSIETGFIIEELQARGLSIPTDIAIVSFGEGSFAKYSYPGYTTIYFPWRELGYVGCTSLARFLEDGTVPMETKLSDVGGIIYRESCGCLPNYVRPVDEEHHVPAAHGPESITDSEKHDIVSSLNTLHRDCKMSFEKVIDSLILAFREKNNMIFLDEINKQIWSMEEYPKINELVCDIRNLFYPYLICDADTMLWFGNLFMQMQVIISEGAACIHGIKVLRARVADQGLQTLNQQLFLNFSLKHLITALEDGMRMLGIDSCHIVVSDSILTGLDVYQKPFDNTVIIFNYRAGKVVEESNRTDTLRNQLAWIRSQGVEEITLGYLLHIADEIMGFVLFGPGTGPMDDLFYQTLSTNISTALHGVVLLNRLDLAYKKLVEHAQKEGMADIAANILHSIGNTLNSMNVSLLLLKESAASQLYDDIVLAGRLLEKNMERLEEFLVSDDKGKKLMRFYLSLGDLAEKLQLQLSRNMKRLGLKINAINSVVTAQQNYAGVDDKFEELLLEPIIEDALKLNQDIFERQSIKVVRDYEPGFTVYVHRGKLFFIIFSILSNAKDAMSIIPNSDKRILIRTYTNSLGKHLMISDSGRGISKVDLERIFEYGFSTKEGRTGYGLHSCSRYIEDMGGIIYAQSEGEKKGATFIIRFS